MTQTSHTMSRRVMLGSSVVVGAGLWLGVAPRGALAAVDAADPNAPSYLQRSTYTGLTDWTFTDVDSASQSTLQLALVNDLADPALSGADDAFSLLLTSSDDTIGQGTVTLSHPQIGQFDVFVVPVSSDAGTYQVIVNRSVDTDAGTIVPATPLATTNVSTSSSSSSSSSSAAPTPSAAPATTVTSTTTTATPNPLPVGHPANPTAVAPAHESVAERVSLRRNRRGLEVGVLLRPGIEVRSLRVALRRDGKRVAVSRAALSGVHANAELVPAHRLTAGSYEVIVTVEGAQGVAPQVTSFPVTLP